MQRGRYGTVTNSPQSSSAEVMTRPPRLPVLVPTDGPECDGVSNCDIRKSLRRVRVVTDAEIFGSTKSLAAVIKKIGQQAWDSFKGVQRLINAHKDNDHLEMRKAYELLFSGLFGKTGEQGAVVKRLATIGSLKRAEFDLPQFVSGLLDDACNLLSRLQDRSIRKARAGQAPRSTQPPQQECQVLSSLRETLCAKSSETGV
jgi:hypothetical protein